MKTFEASELKKLYRPASDSNGEDNGQVTIIGGSSLFHGAPILALKAASRIVDMVFFASPEKSLSSVVSKLKANLSSFIWVPWKEVDAYVEKSDSVLIGPGLMRFTHELKNGKTEKLKNDKLDEEGNKTREITKSLLLKFPHKKWVIDAGSLQTMEADWIPENAIVTPNKKEMEMLFNSQLTMENSQRLAKKYNCVIVAKGPETIVASPGESVLVNGGNAGLTKGGSGDVLAGLTAALLAKNGSFLSASSASFILKAAADELYKKVGVNYNSDDLADKIPEVFGKLINQ